MISWCVTKLVTLFTPNEDWETKIKASQSYLNVTEDARVEKLMKRKFGGLPKTFFKGYQELSDEDFFDLENEDIAKMNLVDRVNLHFKIGHFVEFLFTMIVNLRLLILSPSLRPLKML